jgi:hypothetical protein
VRRDAFEARLLVVRSGRLILDPRLARSEGGKQERLPACFAEPAVAVASPERDICGLCASARPVRNSPRATTHATPPRRTPRRIHRGNTRENRGRRARRSESSPCTPMVRPDASGSHDPQQCLFRTPPELLPERASARGADSRAALAKKGRNCNRPPAPAWNYWIVMGTSVSMVDTQAFGMDEIQSCAGGRAICTGLAPASVEERSAVESAGIHPSHGRRGAGRHLHRRVRPGGLGRDTKDYVRNSRRPRVDRLGAQRQRWGATPSEGLVVCVA